MRASFVLAFRSFLFSIGVCGSLVSTACGEDDDGLISPKKGAKGGASQGGSTASGGTSAASGGTSASAGTGGGGSSVGGAGGSTDTGGAGGGAASVSLPAVVRFSQVGPNSDGGFVQYPTHGEAYFPLVVDTEGNTVTTSSVIAGERTVTTCKHRQEGACSIDQCTSVVQAGSSTGTPKNFASAGDITLTGLAFDQTLTFANDESGYLGSLRKYELWKGGEKGTYQAMGTLDVPAFSGSVVAPPRLNLEKPKPETNSGGFAKYAVDKSMPYEVTWYTDPQAEVSVTIRDNVSPTTTTIDCLLDGAPLKGSIPTSVLTNLGSNPLGGYSIQIGTHRATTAQAGGRPVKLVLRNLTIATFL